MSKPCLPLLICIIIIHFTPKIHCFSKAPPRLAFAKSKSNPVIYLVGSKVQLQCPVYADPKRLFVEWMRNNVPVEHIHRYFVTLNGYLRIEFAQPEDSGVYTCKAANGFGAVTANITLSILKQEDLTPSIPKIDDDKSNYVQSSDYIEDLLSSNYHYADDLQRPYFLTPPTTQVIKKNSGKPLRLRCNVDGNPKPEIVWYKNGSPINPARIPAGSSKFNGILNIPEARIEDSGYYLCVASNIKGQANATFSVTISDKVNRPEIIGINPENNTVLLGQRAFFECQFRSKSEPLVKWLKECSPEELEEDVGGDDKGILIEIDGEYFRSLKSSPLLHKRDGIYYNRLIIDSVDRRDSGKYLCSVVNFKGYAYRTSFLTVVTSIEMNQLRDLGLPEINYCTLLIIVIAIIGCSILVIFFTFFLIENRRRSRGVGGGSRGLGIEIGKRGLVRLRETEKGRLDIHTTDSLSKSDPSVKLPILDQRYQPSFYHHHGRHLQPPTPKFQLKNHHSSLSSSSSIPHQQINHYSNANEYESSSRYKHQHSYYQEKQQNKHLHQYYSNSNQRSTKDYASYQKLTNAVIEKPSTSSSRRSLGIV